MINESTLARAWGVELVTGEFELKIASRCRRRDRLAALRVGQRPEAPVVGIFDHWSGQGPAVDVVLGGDVLVPGQFGLPGESQTCLGEIAIGFGRLPSPGSDGDGGTRIDLGVPAQGSPVGRVVKGNNRRGIDEAGHVPIPVYFPPRRAPSASSPRQPRAYLPERYTSPIGSGSECLCRVRC